MRQLFCSFLRWFKAKEAKPIIPVVSVLIMHRGKILIARRAEEPSKGKWAFIGGHIEKGETFEQTAIRETREEASLEIKIQKELKTIRVLHGDVEYQVHSFIAETENPNFKLNAEITDAKWLSSEEILKLELTFSSRQALTEFLKAI